MHWCFYLLFLPFSTRFILIIFQELKQVPNPLDVFYDILTLSPYMDFMTLLTSQNPQLVSTCTAIVYVPISAPRAYAFIQRTALILHS